MLDSTFVNLFTEETPDTALRHGYVGRFLRCNIYVSSNAREYADEGVGSTTDVYSMLFIAKESFGTVGMAGMLPKDVDSAGVRGHNMTGQRVKPVEIIAKQLGSGGSTDPLNQRATLGWKMAFASSILNSAWIRNLEHTTIASDD